MVSTNTLLPRTHGFTSRKLPFSIGGTYELGASPKMRRPTIEQIQGRQKLRFATILVGCEDEPHSRSTLIRHIEQKRDQLCDQAAPPVKHAGIASTHAMPPCSQ